MHVQSFLLFSGFLSLSQSGLERNMQYDGDEGGLSHGHDYQLRSMYWLLIGKGRE